MTETIEPKAQTRERERASVTALGIADPELLFVSRSVPRPSRQGTPADAAYAAALALAESTNIALAALGLHMRFWIAPDGDRCTLDVEIAAV